ncbi:MAG: FAD-dependent oxidoreductase [Rhizobiales bacterium]|nr:FAD-dependent oxidoreductase [Hyphomicrobiales bacterium]
MRVIIIGGGIAGLGAATYFAEKGHDVEVLEAGSRVGGRSVTLTSRRGDRADAGTQYFHSNYVRAHALMRALGLDKELAHVAGSTRFFDQRTARGHFDVSHRLPWFPPAGLSNLKALGLIAKVLANRRDVFSLDHDPRLDDANAWTQIPDPFMREFALRPLLLAGALAEPAVSEPSLLHVFRLFRIVVLTNYLVLPNGIASFAAALAARLRVTFDSPVRRVAVKHDAVVGAELEGSGHIVRADHVVVALPPPRAAALLPEHWIAERRYLSGITIPAFSLVSFFLDRPLGRGIWSYVLPENAARHVSFITDASRKSPAMVPSGKSVLQAWTCYPASQGFTGLHDGEIVELCRRELEAFFPGISDWIDEAHVTRHPYAVPLHQVGHQRRTIDFLRLADSRKGISFCGDYLTGGFMEAALWSAERAALRHA